MSAVLAAVPDPEPVHAAHSLDGYPICWSQDQDGPHTSTSDDRAVTCLPCRHHLEDR